MNTPSSGANVDSEKPPSLGITGASKLAVPTFSCIIYICKTADGTISGRVANLRDSDADEISASGHSERDVLLQLTRQFKLRVSHLHSERQEIPWIDPPPPPLENEQVRYVPVHL